MTLPNEIKEARELLEKAERTSDPMKKARALEEAIELFELYDEDNPSMNAMERELITNLRRSHTRRLLTQLMGLKNIEIDIWFEYIKLLMLKLKPEVDYVVQGSPELRSEYDKFVDIWRKEMLEALRE